MTAEEETMGGKTTFDRLLQNTTSDYHQRMARQLDFLRLRPGYIVKTGPTLPSPSPSNSALTLIERL